MKLALVNAYTREVMVTKTKSKREDVYTYEGDGAKLTFHAHPTRAWVWQVIRMESNHEGERLQKKILNAFTKAMMATGTTPKELTI